MYHAYPNMFCKHIMSFLVRACWSVCIWSIYQVFYACFTYSLYIFPLTLFCLPVRKACNVLFFGSSIQAPSRPFGFEPWIRLWAHLQQSWQLKMGRELPGWCWFRRPRKKEAARVAPSGAKWSSRRIAPEGEITIYQLCPSTPWVTNWFRMWKSIMWRWVLNFTCSLCFAPHEKRAQRFLRKLVVRALNLCAAVVEKRMFERRSRSDCQSSVPWENIF